LAWCPSQTEMVRKLIEKFMTYEPMASVTEMEDSISNIVTELDSYDWNEQVTDSSIFTVAGRSEINQMINDRFFPSDHASTDMWEGGSVVSFGDSSLPPYYYECSTIFTGYLPDRLKQGVCFVNAYARETGMSFIMQLLLDIGALFGIYGIFKTSIQEVIYMMTGVKPWVANRQDIYPEIRAQISGRNK